MIGRVHVNNLSDLAEFCAELVRQGIVFEAFHDGKQWVVEMKGGH